LCLIPWEQFVETIDLVIVNAVEHVSQIGLRINAFHFGRRDIFMARATGFCPASAPAKSQLHLPTFINPTIIFCHG